MAAGTFAVGALLSACGERSNNSVTPAPGAAEIVSPDPAPLVTLDASPTRVSPGGTLSLTLSNRTPNQISYHECSGTLEVMLETLNGSSVRDDRICAFELTTLGAGRAARYVYQAPRNIGRGKYRLATGVDGVRSDMGLVVMSNPIEVR